jgi:hypothetical protein
MIEEHGFEFCRRYLGARNFQDVLECWRFQIRRLELEGRKGCIDEKGWAYLYTIFEYESALLVEDELKRAVGITLIRART